jgi:hypothetical protein
MVYRNIQLQGRENILSEYESTVEEIYEKWGQERIGDFIDDVLQEAGLRRYTLAELESKFHEKNPGYTSERYSRILRERYDEIIESINLELKTRAEEFKQRPFGSPTMQRHSIPRYFNKDQ